MRCGSRSVAKTWPLEPTWRHNHAAMEPPPPATSRQRHPSATPTMARFRIVHGSDTVSSRASRSRAAFHVLSNAYWYSAIVPIPVHGSPEIPPHGLQSFQNRQTKANPQSEVTPAEDDSFNRLSRQSKWDRNKGDKCLCTSSDRITAKP